MNNDKHFKMFIAAHIKWPKNRRKEDLIAYVLLRIPSHFIYLYDSLEIKCFFKKRTKIYEGNYTLIADNEKNVWFCTDFDVAKVSGDWKTGGANSPRDLRGRKDIIVVDDIDDDTPAYPIEHAWTDVRISILGMDITDGLQSIKYGDKEIWVSSLVQKMSKDDKLKAMNEELLKAEQMEDYEYCAQIRDKILNLKNDTSA